MTIVLSDSQIFQHLVGFYYGSDFYHRTVIVTAAVHRGFFCKHYNRSRNTHAINLPALGRLQPVYILFRVCTDLCFW